MWCGTRRCPARFHKIVCRTHIMFQSIFLPIFVVAVGVLLKLQNGMKMKYCSPHNELLVGNMHHFISILSLFRLFTIVFTCFVFFFTRFLMSTSTKAGDFSTKKKTWRRYTLSKIMAMRVYTAHTISRCFFVPHCGEIVLSNVRAHHSHADICDASTFVQLVFVSQYTECV